MDLFLTDPMAGSSDDTGAATARRPAGRRRLGPASWTGCVHATYRILRGLGVVLLLFWASLPGYAQSPEERARQQADRIEREEAQRQRLERTLERRERDLAPRGTRPRAPLPAAPSADDAACVQVEEVVVEGVTLLPQGAIARAVSAFEDRCVGLADLNLILETVTFLYVDAGYVASRAYLPPQDLSDGTLAIVVVEGVLEDIVMDGDPGRGRIQTAFPGLKGRPVNLRDIEQGLEQLNRLRSINARMELQPGTEPGGSVLRVFTQSVRPVHFSVDSDNLGVDSTGRYQTRFSIGIDNVLSLNDQWNFSYQRSMERHPWRYAPDRSNSYTHSAALSVPYGYWTYSIDANRNGYKSDIPGTVSAINTSGNSKAVHADVHRVLLRDQVSKTSLSGGLTWKDSKNYILGSLIEVSSRTLTTAGLELTHSHRLLGGWIAASLGRHQGLDIWGAYDDDQAPPDSPKGQFSKWDFRLNFTRPFEFAGLVPATYDGSVSGQWSDDRLFGSEQMSLGGYSSVRGVRAAQLFGNRAVMMRNEWSVQWSRPGDGGGVLERYVGFDCGAVFAQAAFGVEGDTLCGATLGLRNRGGWFDFDVQYAETIATSHPGVLHVQLSVSL